MIIKCAGCGNSIDLLGLNEPTEVDIGTKEKWKLLAGVYRGDICNCGLPIRNPEKEKEALEWIKNNPGKYQNSVDQLGSEEKRKRLQE